MAKVSTLESLLCVCVCVCVCFYILIVSQLFVCVGYYNIVLDSSCIRNFEGTHGRVCIVSLVGKDLSYLMICTCPLNFLTFTFALFILYISFYNFTRGSDQISFSLILVWPHVNMYFDKRSLNWWWVDKKYFFIEFQFSLEPWCLA
jgi:hypothetical protein